MKKKIGLIALGLAVGGSLLVWQLNTQKQWQTVQIGLVSDIGGIDDRSFSEGAWEGLQGFQTLRPLAIAYTQTTREAQRQVNLQVRAEQDQLVIVPGEKYAAALAAVATNNPDTGFIFLDAELEKPLANVLSIDFKEEQAGYLVGVAAALQTKTSRVAFVGGESIPAVRAFEQGFKQGVSATRADVEVTSTYVNSFQEQQLGFDCANQLYAQGNDIIFAAAGAVGIGVMEAAKTHVQAGNPVFVIGVDRDQYEDGLYAHGKSVVLTSALKRMDRVIAEVMAMVFEGTAAFGSVQTFDMSTDAVGIPQTNPNIHDEATRRHLQNVRYQLASGQITIPLTD